VLLVLPKPFLRHWWRCEVVVVIVQVLLVLSKLLQMPFAVSKSH
jgi:hypothetical protein